jgi:hypothetical protein
VIAEGAGGPVVPEVYSSPYTTKCGAAGVARLRISRASWLKFSIPVGAASTPSTLVSADTTSATRMRGKLKRTIVESAYRVTGIVRRAGSCWSSISFSQRNLYARSALLSQ